MTSCCPIGRIVGLAQDVPGAPRKSDPPCTKYRFTGSQILSENHPQLLPCYISMWEISCRFSSSREALKMLLQQMLEDADSARLVHPLGP